MLTSKFATINGLGCLLLIAGFILLVLGKP